MAKKRSNPPTRGTVRVVIGLFDDGMSLEWLEQVLQEARSRIVTENLRNARLDFETTRGYYDDVSISVRLIANREETDEEMKLRIEQEREETSKREQWDREHFERMKRQYGWS